MSRQEPSEPAAPQVTAQRITSSNRFFAFIEDDLRLQDGSDYTYYHLRSNFDAVIVVPVLDDGRLVLEHIYRHPYGRFVWEFPAGGIEPGEDPALAAARELEEETGYCAARVTPLVACEAMPGLLHMRLHFMLASGLTSGGRRDLDPMELLTVRAYSLAEAWALAQESVASSFLTMALLAYERYRQQNPAEFQAHG